MRVPRADSNDARGTARAENSIARVLLLAAALATGAYAQSEEPSAPDQVEATQTTAEIDIARKVSDALKGDAGMQASLARRILGSSIAEQIVGSEPDPQAAVENWVRAHPDDAAHLAIGFAQDDENGNEDFETSLHERVRRYMRLNPERSRGLLGVLMAAGGESKTIRKLGKKMDEEEQRELVKKLFEGQGGAQGRVLKQPDEGGGGERSDPGNPNSVAGSSAYDRLSELNPSGYSPNVLSLQSALNAQRPPGAPKLVETGRLDYPTLVHPIYALRSDLGRQEAGLRARSAWANAQALGRAGEFKVEQYSDPAVQAKLEKAAAGAKVPPRVARRRLALEKARNATVDFEQAAGRMREPSSVNKAALRELSARQKEASRWLLVATLEADLERLEAESAFWTPELEKLITMAPAPEPARRGFLNRAKDVASRLARIRAHDENALAGLMAADYAARWGHVERELSNGNRLRRGLSRDLTLVSRVPAGLHGASRPSSGWREWLERWARRLAPSTSIAKEAAARERRGGAWSEAFASVAAGDFARAQRAAEQASSQ